MYFSIAKSSLNFVNNLFETTKNQEVRFEKNFFFFFKKYIRVTNELKLTTGKNKEVYPVCAIVHLL